MLCPEIRNYQLPKVITSHKQLDDISSVVNVVEKNSFYQSVIVTCPDEVQTPKFIEECLTDDSDYYKIYNCPLTEFTEAIFIDKFVNNGKLFCLSTDKDCIAHNCAAVTPDGVLTIHILDFIYQTLGLEGIKRPHNFYELKIDLKHIKYLEKLKQALSKIENQNFLLSWIPNNDEICPSSIAKYLFDRGINISVCTQEINKLSPSVPEIPSIKDTEIDEIVEWIGMIALQTDIAPEDDYVYSYTQPESDFAIKSNNISVFTVKGFLTQSVVLKLCESMAQYISTRELENYWASISIQSFESNLWQWDNGQPRMFQAMDCSCNIFLTNEKHTYFSIGQLKYS